jgi:methyltransferase, FkbM family
MIQSTPKQLFKKFIGKFIMPCAKLSYSQFGEDLIIEHFFNQVDIKKPTYLDIGANEPKYISNTYYFYEHGSRGVLVEPNPYLYKKILKYRLKDQVVNAGIGVNNINEADFYMFPDKYNGLSTFSEKEALHWKNVGMKGLGKINYEKIMKIPLLNINSILEQYFNEKAPNLISLDVEGLDLDILKSIDYKKWRPEIICVETLQYNENQQGFKNHDIINFMLQNEYAVYADTYVNTIFCKKELITK